MRTFRPAAAFILCLSIAPSVLAGDINPPAGPVAPTMKTLDEIEPRTPIHQADIPLTITTPGGYVLAEPLTATGPASVIDIQAENVSIDLAGFTITGIAGSTTAITSGSGADAATIANGAIASFEGTGIDMPNSDRVRLENLRISACLLMGADLGDDAIVRGVHASDCGLTGLVLGRGAVVTACVASDNIAGFAAEAGATFSDCTAYSNTTTGFTLTDGDGALTGCVAYDNNADGFRLSSGSTADNCLSSANAGSGFFANAGSTLTGCVARQNDNHGFVLGFALPTGGARASECYAYFNGGQGYQCSTGSTVTRCTADSNGSHGIWLFDDCRATGNSLVNNGRTSVAAGILCSGDDNHVEDNRVSKNDHGIQVTGAGCLILRNSASGNTTADYDLGPGNAWGPIISVGGVGDISAVPGANDPQANLIY